MKFKNVSEQVLELPGKGIVNPGDVVEMPEDFNNANFEKVNSPQNKKVDGDKSEPLENNISKK